MDHNTYKELLSALLDGELGGAEREAALAHMDNCADCRAYFEELTALRAALADLEEFDAPEGFAEGVMARLRAGDAARVGNAVAPPEMEAAPKKLKARVPRRAYAAFAACAAVVLFAVYALPDALRMGGNSAAADRVMQAAPATAAPTGDSGAPMAAPEAPDPGNNYVYANGSEAGGAGAVMESATTVKGSPMDAARPASTKDRTSNGALNDTPESAAEDAMEGAENDNAYNASDEGEKMSISNGGETPIRPLNPFEAYDGELPVLILSGEGAARWLAENGWQDGDGVWYAGAAALRALPEELTVRYSEVPEDYDGAVLVDLWEAEP